MIIALRIFGKKENTSDIILILLISNSVQNAMVGSNNSLTGVLVAATVLFLINYILKKALFKFKFLSKLNITFDELREAMREHGIDHFSDVKLSMLEVDGNISMISGNGNLKQTHYKRLKKLKKAIE